MIRSILFLLGFITQFAMLSFSQKKEGIALLEELLRNSQFEQASTEIESQLIDLKQLLLYDSLAQYPYYIAKVEAGLSDVGTANSAGLDFMESLRKEGATARQQYEAYMSFVYFLSETGQVRKSKEITLQALELAKIMEDATAEEIGFTEYNLGVDAWGLGNFDLARSYIRSAVQRYESYEQTSPGKMADAYNALGAMLWLGSQPDSARVFYQKSIEAVSISDADTIDKAFRIAITLSNIALIEHARFQTTNAIASLERTLELHQFVIQNTTDDHQRSRAGLFRLRAMSNLASFYNSIGNYRLAAEMVSFVYATYLETLYPGDTEIYKALIRVGEAQMSLRNYRKANEIFREVLELIENSDAENYYWKGITYSNLAESESELGDNTNAEQYFRTSKRYFDQALGGSYDRYYLSSLGKKASLLARTGKNQEAVATVNHAFDFIMKTQAGQGVTVLRYIADLAEVFFLVGDYQNAEKFASMAFETAEKESANITSVAASLQLERQLPRIHMIRARTMFYKMETMDTLALQNIYNELLISRVILERRARYFATGDNVNALIDENRELFDWLKKVSLELYNATGNYVYLDNLIDYHEFSVFQRIRLRFLLRNSTLFYGVPQEVINREWEILGRFSEVMDEPKETGMIKFSSLMDDWELYLEMLSSEYPQYYNMRFGSINGNINMVQNSLVPETTIVRYFYVMDDLMALVITPKKARIIKLTSGNILHKTRKLNTFLPESEEISLLNNLYRILWKPISDWVTTHNVIILPDRELFNLSFETLVDDNASSYRDMALHSLLAKHAISYNFSLSVMQNQVRNRYKSNYVAFVPGFTHDMKQAYSSLFDHDGEADQEYMHLLPQPFTIQVAREIQRNLGGSVFREEQSTRSNFINNAGNSLILHIGTHAEANNISPGFSRLIFAKDINPGTTTGSNHLYAHEIYHYNLASKLAVLTACETGLPQHMPGEGMTSLAHAFFYAGSESLLISLWKIDEHASAIVMSAFYRYLRQGDNKAEALRKARLDYLSSARGRTLAPVYWAGIVLMGDPSPIAIDSKYNRLYIFGFLLFVSILLLFALLIRRKHPKTG